MTKWINGYIGKQVHQFRTNKGLSQETLGRALGVSRTSIANYEAGNQAISIADLFNLAIFLEKEIADFLPTMDEVKVRTKQPQQKINEDSRLPDNIKEELTAFIKNVQSNK